ncbi:hypothetical protein JCM11641_006473 [Rhodosporidiobolus odoratus]
MLVLVIGDLHIPTRAHDLPAKFKKLLVPGKISQILSTGNISDTETKQWLRGIVAGATCGGMGEGDALKGVRGDWDDPSPHLPPSLTLHHGPLKIGLISGSQIVPLGDAEVLAATARKMDVDVLISGGTHRFEAFESDGRFFLNPGSATGAFSPTFIPPTRAAAVPQGERTDKPEGGSGGEGEEGDKRRERGSEEEEKEGGGGGGGVEEEEREEDEEEEEGPTPSFALLDIQGNVVVTYVYTEKGGDVQVEKMEFRKSAHS